MSLAALRQAAEHADRTFGTGAVGDDVRRCPECHPVLLMYFDADRDGKVDDAWSWLDVWEYGKKGRGAIVRANNDADGASRTAGTLPVPDNENDFIESSAADLADLAPIAIRRFPTTMPFPPGYRAVLQFAPIMRFFGRVFESVRPQAKAVLGPSSGEHYELPDLTATRVDLCMEAIRYSGHYFDGDLELWLSVFDPRGDVVSRQTGVLRVAPWIMPHALDPTELVYVRDRSPAFDVFMKTLESAVASVGATLEKIPPPPLIPGRENQFDVWVQDVMELGFASAPTDRVARDRWAVPVVVRTPRDRSQREPAPTLDTFPRRRMLGADFGFYQDAPPSIASTTMDSFGNLECTPPVRVGRKEYRFGRIVFGSSPNEADNMRASMRAFLIKQQVQSPFSVDTSWLVVRHVDEVLSFCPFPRDSDPYRRFRIVIASPALAMATARELVSERQGLTAFFSNISTPAGATQAHIDKALENFPLQDAQSIVDDKAFEQHQRTCQVAIDRIEARVLAMTGLTKEHVIRLPVFYVLRPVDNKDPSRGTRYVSYLPNSANMLVLTRADSTPHLVIPKPFGPNVSGQCRFEKKIREALAPTGAQITFIDDFFSYHTADGNVHCATNSKRKVRRDFEWWDRDPLEIAPSAAED